jgi:D-aminopeptidase
MKRSPLVGGQCDRLAQRVGLGVARMGGVGEDTSGDLFIAFATGNLLPIVAYSPDTPRTVRLEMVTNAFMTPLFDAVVEATEEAILNALLAAQTMTGRDGITAYALEPDRLLTALRRLGAPFEG